MDQRETVKIVDTPAEGLSRFDLMKKKEFDLKFIRSLF
jgi:hypothetical protein